MGHLVYATDNVTKTTNENVLDSEACSSSLNKYQI